MNVETIRALLEAHGPELRDDHGVGSLMLFGSVARGEATEGSDIDMLVEFNRPASYFGLVVLQDYLTTLSSLLVDLRTALSLKPRMRKGVKGHAQRVL